MTATPAAPTSSLARASSLTMSPAWRIVRDADTVRCIGGPDEFHVLSELSTETLDAIEGWALNSQPIHATSAELVEVCDFLGGIGALLNHGAESNGTIRWHSVGPGAVTESIAAAVQSRNVAVGADLTVVIRTGGLLTDLVSEASKLGNTRQLLVDLTGHHTISLGPFVTPQYSSCIGCYTNRLARAWGDELAAPEPASQRWTAIVAELVAIQLELVAANASPLVNATINWDLHTGASTRDHLLRSPDCSLCRSQLSGKLSLPWSER